DIFVEDVVGFTRDRQVWQSFNQAGIALVFDQNIAPTDSPVTAVIVYQKFSCDFFTRIFAFEWNCLSPSTTDQGNFVSITRSTIQIVKNRFEVLNSQSISMLICFRTAFSYICRDGKQPSVDRFTTTDLSVFPQPNDLIVEIRSEARRVAQYLI